MQRRRAGRVLRLSFIASLAACCAIPSAAYARTRRDSVDPNDPTYRLFSLLDRSYGGKLTDFYLLADVYADSSQPGRILQHVLLVNYDKDLFFGRLTIRVRGVSQPTPGQLSEYTPAQIYGFGSDVEKFEKIDPGPFGESGDVYFRAAGDRALAAAPITGAAKSEYESLLHRYILPALER